MEIAAMPYPDPQILVADNSAISIGFLIRYTPVSTYGTPLDTQDCIVRQIYPIEGSNKTGELDSRHCLYVTVLEPPSRTTPRRLIGDVRVEGESYRTIDRSDIILRADGRHSPFLVEYVDKLASSGIQISAGRPA